MKVPFALNITFGSFLVLILILIDYLRNYNTDRFQRKIFCRTLLFALFSAICHMLFYMIEGIPDQKYYFPCYLFTGFNHFFLGLTYYHCAIFVDYTIFKNSQRTKKINIVCWVLCGFYFLILVLNIKSGFFFYINTENYFTQGSKYFIRSIFSYSPLLIIAYDFISARKFFKEHHLYMVIFIVILCFIGSTLDILFKTANLILPCLTAALLYAYFFIIRTDIQIDVLTGLGNRYSFNEFIDKLSRLNTGEAHAIVMIDMDHFKEINDTLGHQEGDNALRDMAAIIKSCIRSSDFAARYGGDEFILATNAKFQIEKLMERIQQAIGIQNERHIRPFDIQISYGYDIFTNDGSQTIEEFLAHIDRLMYKHKEEQRRATDIKKEALA